MSSSKKRKRTDIDTDNDATVSVSLKPSSLTTTQLGPVLASFPAVKPPSSTSFKCYALKKKARPGIAYGEDDEEEQEEFAEQETLIVGEAPLVEYVTALEETKRASAGGCRYLIAVYNPKTHSATLHPAPMHILSQTIKPLKYLAHPTSSTLELQQPPSLGGAGRAALGEAFGTKKSKAAIRAAERNKVDVGAMEGVVGTLLDRIEEGTEGLPSVEQAKESSDSNRLIPPHNADATDPNDVYALHDIIPEMEWKALSVSSLIDAPDPAARTRALPYSRSSWVNAHMEEVGYGVGSKKTLKLLLYISAMLAFRASSFKKPLERENLHERLSGIPTIVVDGLWGRFTESTRGAERSQVTTRTETMLLTNLLALCLRVDNYATDLGLIAADLNMALPRVSQLFKSLGCKIQVLSERDHLKLGLSAAAGESKRAMLKVPLEFPKVRGKRTAR